MIVQPWGRSRYLCDFQKTGGNPLALALEARHER